MAISNTHILVIIVSILLISGVWLFATREHAVTNYPSSGTIVVVFGDSLAAGVGATADNDFASLLAQRLDTDIRNMGVSGDTSETALKRIDELLESDPRVVILLLGGNDALKKKPVDETFRNLNTIITAIQEVGAAVLLVGEPGGLYGKQYLKEYERLAETHGLAYVENILNGLIGRPQYMADALHPNDAGNAVMADRIEPILRDLLEGN